jgi:hypothetical protein
VEEAAVAPGNVGEGIDKKMQKMGPSAAFVLITMSTSTDVIQNGRNVNAVSTSGCSEENDTDFKCITPVPNVELKRNLMNDLYVLLYYFAPTTHC